MASLEKLLIEEKSKNVEKQEQLRAEISNLPKGSITIKKIREHDYYYLKFRDDKKVITQYIGKDIEMVADYKDKINERKKHEEELKILMREYKQICKLVK